MCDENGEWGEVDFSMCTMRSTATPLIVFEVNTTSSTLDTSAIINEVRWAQVYAVKQNLLLYFLLP